jgi:AcrR family transcriptional regulator
VTKSDDRRAAIIDKLADYVLAEGLSASSLRPLADAAGTSDRMLLYYFKDKADLISAALERVSLRFAGHLQSELSGKRLPYEQLRKKVLKIVLAPESWPYMRVWLEIAANAARDDAFYRAVGEQIARGFLAFTEAQLDAPPAKRRAEALRLLVTIEGTMLLKSMGLDEVARL